MVHINDIFAVFSFLSFFTCCIMLQWHLDAWNVGTCLYRAWLGLASLIFFINAIVWKDNYTNWAPVWCDISVRFVEGLNVAVPACLCCIYRRLYCISSMGITVTKAEKRRAVMEDLGIGLGIPIAVILLEHMCYASRFNILEDVGCSPAIYLTPLAVGITNVPPLLLSLISAIYAALSIRHFLKLRSHFDEILGSGNNSRYRRLIILGVVEIIFDTPLCVWVLCISLKNISPWTGWDNNRPNFSMVQQFPSAIWRSQTNAPEITRWLTVFASLMFFAFFGFSKEARRNYRFAAQSVINCVGVLTRSLRARPSKSNKQAAVLPTFVMTDNRNSISIKSVSSLNVGNILNQRA